MPVRSTPHTASLLIDDAVVDELNALSGLAPLHNGPALEVIAPTDLMRAAFAQLDSILSHTERPGAILLLDEAHLLADDRGRERFPLSGLLAALGAVQRQQPRVRIVVCGLPTLSLNLKRARTYAERMFRHAVVGNLELDAAEEALAIPLAASRRSFGLSLISEIVEQTAGYPYFLQFFAAFACSRIGLEDIELADYQRVESALLHELDLAFFEDRFEGAAPSEQVLLLAMAHAGGRVGLAKLGSEIPAGHPAHRARAARDGYRERVWTPGR